MRKNLFLILGFLMLMVSCQPKVDKFTVNGTIIEANGKTLYFENLGIDMVIPVDSIVLDIEGKFNFSQPRPESFDFYRLRVENQTINLIIDSTETITVTASYPTMLVAYKIEGSENCSVLKDLVLQQIGFQKEINKLINSSSGVSKTVLQEKIEEMTGNFKTSIKNQFIFPNPAKPYAYYALFISVNGSSIFRPMTDRQDAKCFAAVATMMDQYFPNTLRTVNLKNRSLKAMRNTSTPVPASEELNSKFANIVYESGIIDIELPDMNGKIHKLSQLKGKVVMLDFTAYKASYSGQYNLLLRDIYNKYSNQGFEIYQVSIDEDAHFWTTSAVRLPWICVRDEQTLQSEYLLRYHINTLPSAFLINKENEIVERLTDHKDLESKIINLLHLQ